VDGTTPFSYQWPFNGTNFVWRVHNAIDVTSVTMDYAGTYAVVVTNNAGLTVSSNAVLVVCIQRRRQRSTQSASPGRAVPPGAVGVLRLQLLRWLEVLTNLSDWTSFGTRQTPLPYLCGYKHRSGPISLFYRQCTFPIKCSFVSPASPASIWTRR